MQIDGTVFCCGLDEIGDFGSSSKNQLESSLSKGGVYGEGHILNYGVALFANTTKDQKGAIQFLKAHRFKAVRRWKGKHGRYITMWFRAPGRK